VDAETHPTESLDVRALFRPVRARWWLILAVVAVATAGTYVYYASKPKRYTASTDVLIRPGEADPGFSSGDAGRTSKNILRLLKSSPVVEAVKQDAGVSGHASAAASTDSDFVTITATADSPDSAARVANAYADALVTGRGDRLQRDSQQALRIARQDLAALPPGPQSADTRATLQARIADLQAALSLPRSGAERIGVALPPNGPSAPRPLRNAAFALILSLMLAVAAAYLLDRLDGRIKRAEDAERAYGLELVGVIPHATHTAHEFFREAFRTLLTTIQCTNLDQPPRTILVTSALPGEGKSMIVRNLALAARDSGLRVAIVESDLRQPSLATIFRVQATPGLLNVLSDGVGLRDALQTVGADTAVATERASATVTAQSNGDAGLGRKGSIAVLTSGSLTTNPPAVLLTERAASLFDEIAAEYDLTFIDSSPLLTVSDSVPLLSRTDATILSCRVGVATVPAARRVTELLARHPRSRVLGVVANDVPAKEFERRFAGYYGTGAAPARPQ
jgi:Mrp family chromosome partitioning ATPase/capsular polysaccharide biosynthesis protein